MNSSRLLSTTKRAIGSAWVRWGFAVIILGVGVYLAFVNQKIMMDAWNAVINADPLWLLISFASVVIALYSMAQVMRLLYQAAGVSRATRRATNSLVLASNAWSVTVPGGAAFSTVLQARRQYQWGASPVIISWFILLSGALSFLGLAVLAVLSLFFIGSDPAPSMLIGAGAGVLALTLLLWWFSRNTALIEKISLWGLSLVNRVRKLPLDHGAEKTRITIQQLTKVKVGPWRLFVVFSWSMVNWLADVLCLYAAIRAIGVEDISVTAVLLAFVTGKVAGFLQATPGGVGPVEALLTGTLMAAGLGASEAFAAILIYRIMSLIIPAVVGWIIFFVSYGGESPRQENQERDKNPLPDASSALPSNSPNVPDTSAAPDTTDTYDAKE